MQINGARDHLICDKKPISSFVRSFYNWVSLQTFLYFLSLNWVQRPFGTSDMRSESLACRKFPSFGPPYRWELALHCIWVMKSGPKVRTWERVSVFNMFFFPGVSEQIEFPWLFNPISHESHLVTGFKQLTEPDSYHLSISVHQHLGHQMLMTL